MNRTAKLSYGVAASCFAAALSMTSNTAWWEAHTNIAAMLGFSIPVCVLAAWMAETRLEDRNIWGFDLIFHSPAAMIVAAWCGIVVGLVALGLFLLTLSHAMALGFFLGGMLLSLFTSVREVRRRE
ncbi:MAG: hypothetical protein ACYCVX_02610 [Thiobacillus sp.]